MVSSSSFIKCSIAIFLILQVAVSAFAPPATSGSVQRDFSCLAKKENSPGKTAFKGNSSVGGVGGMFNFSRAKSASKPAAAAVVTKKSTNRTPAKKVAASKKSTSKKTPAEIIDQGGFPGGAPKADIDWGKIFLAFMTPWRNPNSIFLYLLIIVSILGETNK